MCYRIDSIYLLIKLQIIVVVLCAVLVKFIQVQISFMRQFCAHKSKPDAKEAINEGFFLLEQQDVCTVGNEANGDFFCPVAIHCLNCWYGLNHSKSVALSPLMTVYSDFLV